MSDWLVSFDTDRIKEYLFATNKLKEIRGASALLDRLNERDTPAVVRQTCPVADKVYSSGGGALFRVPSELDAQAVKKAVEKLYRTETVIASIAGAFQPCDPQRKFGEQVRELAPRLRRHKDEKAEAPTVSVTPYLRFCDSCGRYPAAQIEPDEEGESRPLCLACYAKRKAERNIEPSDADPYVTAGRTKRFDELGELSRPSGYLGFIQADGNQIGDLFFDLDTPRQYRDFAAGLRTLMKSATKDALEKFGKPRARNIVPYELLLLGGDDLLLVTTADIAIDVTLAIAAAFERDSGQLLTDAGRQGRRLTLAAGVVIAHADFPIAAMSRLSDRALRSAKRHCLEHGYVTGAVDFTVVTSAVSGDAPERQTQVANDRPYTLDRLKQLMDHISELRKVGFPRSQLQAMYEALYVSPTAATLASISALGRTRPERRRQALWRFFEWSGALGPERMPPWKERDGRPRTALSDLVEVFPFIPTRGDD